MVKTDSPLIAISQRQSSTTGENSKACFAFPRRQFPNKLKLHGTIVERIIAGTYTESQFMPCDVDRILVNIDQLGSIRMVRVNGVAYVQ